MSSWLLRRAARVALARPGLVALLGRGADPALDRQVAAVLAAERLLRLPALESMEPAAARRYAEAGMSPLDVAPAAMAAITDLAAPVPIRVYTPRDAGPHWIVYLHGGGGVIGSIHASDAIARFLAARTGARVASVGYRLGPEHRHPAAIEDALAAWDAIVERAGRGARIAVAGDSFGGFLAAHVDHAARRRPDLQLLIYPLTDLTLASPAIDRLAEGYLLTRSMIHWFRANYLHPDDDRRAPSPAFWPSLAGAAPAIVATAGFDPLVDDGDAHASRLRDAGVAVRHRRYPSLIHGFLSLGGAIPAARAAIEELAADVRELLA